MRTYEQKFRAKRKTAMAKSWQQLTTMTDREVIAEYDKLARSTVVGTDF